MTGLMFMRARTWQLSIAVVGVLILTACDDSGGFAFPTASNNDESRPLPATTPNQRVESERDIERPDIFEVSDRGLWDGRPSLGGVWVAHPDVQDPDRVMIKNTENGRTIIGALFRRERENPGPLLQVSSDAAEELGMLAGAPTQLAVVVLRREEIMVDDTPLEEANPVIASLDAPVNVEAAPLEPVEASGAVVAVAETTAAAVAVVLPPAVEAATLTIEQTALVAAPTVNEASETTEPNIDVSAILSPAPVDPVIPEPELINDPSVIGSVAQIGVFSVEGNASEAAQRIIAAGISADVLPEEIGGRTVWRVVAGPLREGTDIGQLNRLGFVDAFVAADEE